VVVLSGGALSAEHQFVVRVNVVHVVRRDQFVLRKDRRRHGTVVQEVERDGDVAAPYFSRAQRSSV
jgi:hypothetical protein